MAKLSGRLIDYSQEEMLEMTGLTRQQFRRKLIKLCEMYSFDIDNFKVEKDNINSEFFFIPEVAQLLAILLRNFDKHPLKRANAKVEEISSTDIKEYYEVVLKDIDEEVHPVIAESIYCMESHLVAQNTADWSGRFAKQLTHFLVNLTTLKRQDIGESLKQFTKQLDKMNYNLYKGEYVMSLAYDSNIKELHKYGLVDGTDRKEVNRRLHQSNISIDRLIAEMIRWYLPRAVEVRNNKFQEYVFEDNEMMRFLACGNPNEASTFGRRELYYRLEVNYSANRGVLKNNQYILEQTKIKNAEWKDIATRIEDGNYCEPQEMSVAERIEAIESNILYYEKQLEGCKEILQKLKEKEFEDEKNELLDKVQQGYVKHYKEIEGNYPELEYVVDKFVGRAIYELLKM